MTAVATLTPSEVAEHLPGPAKIWPYNRHASVWFRRRNAHEKRQRFQSTKFPCEKFWWLGWNRMPKFIFVQSLEQVPHCNVLCSGWGSNGESSVE